VNFAFDVQREQALRTHDDNGQPLPEPQAVELTVVAFTDAQHVDGPQRYEYALLPPFAERLLQQLQGSPVEIVGADALRHLPGNGAGGPAAA
jgi:hypothetical protein